MGAINWSAGFIVFSNESKGSEGVMIEKGVDVWNIGLHDAEV